MTDVVQWPTEMNVVYRYVLLSSQKQTEIENSMGIQLWMWQRFIRSIVKDLKKKKKQVKKYQTICFGLFLMVETDVKQASMLKVILITGDIQAK